jgi:iodotyrosine deiodinase
MMVEKKFEKLEFTEKSETGMIADSKSFYDLIKTRRTVRDFSNRTIPEEVIKNAILSAGTAPNGANLQPWHFVVVSDPKIKHEIRVAAEKEEKEFYQQRASDEWLNALRPFATDENKPFLEEAPNLIAVFMKNSIFDDQGKTHKTYYPVESVGIATGMLISALHFAGLATLTHTPSPMRFLNKILQRPDSERPFLIVVTGYPHENAQVPEINKNPLEKISTFI